MFFSYCAPSICCSNRCFWDGKHWVRPGPWPIAKLSKLQPKDQICLINPQKRALGGASPNGGASHQTGFPWISCYYLQIKGPLQVLGTWWTSTNSLLPSSSLYFYCQASRSKLSILAVLHLISNFQTQPSESETKKNEVLCLPNVFFKSNMTFQKNDFDALQYVPLFFVPFEVQYILSI